VGGIIQSLDSCRSGILDRVFTGERTKTGSTADKQLVFFRGLDVGEVLSVFGIRCDGDRRGSVAFSPWQTLPKLLLKRC
jgi:hypothetical protein